MTPPIPIRYLSLAAAAIVMVAASSAVLKRMRRKSPEQVEAERRDYLNLHGRIIDGTIIDYAEVANPDDPQAPVIQLLIFNYDVGGVEYEASQDVTYLRHLVDVHSCRIGLPASVRYDPHLPENSMVVSEAWTGLRSGIISHALPERSPAASAAKQPELFASARKNEVLGQANSR